MSEVISRRVILQLLGAAPAALSLPQAVAVPQGGTPVDRARVGLVSRHVQWTSVEGAIQVAAEAGFDAIEWNVRTGGHVPPDRVEQELPGSSPSPARRAWT